MCKYMHVQNRKSLRSLDKDQFLSTSIQLSITTHGDTIYVFLWVEEDRQFMWSWFGDK